MNEGIIWTKESHTGLYSLMVGGRSVSSKCLYEEYGIIPVPPLCLLHGWLLKVSNLLEVAVPVW